MSLKLKKVRLPKSTQFAEQISTIISWCHQQKPGKNKPRVKSIADLHTACATIVEGLYQAWSAVGKTVDLEMALSPQYYHSTAPAKINHLSHYFVTLALDGLVALGWVRVKKGFQRAGVNEVTRVRASGTLLDAFSAVGCQWFELKPAGEVIFLRDKDSVTGERIPLIAPDTQKVRAMRRKLQKINEFIGKQAIRCLALEQCPAFPWAWFTAINERLWRAARLGLTRLVAFFQSLPPALVHAALTVAIPKVALHVKQSGGECDPHDHIIRAMQFGLFRGFEPARRLISQNQCG